MYTAHPLSPLVLPPAGAAGNPPEVTSLADEIVAHLRTLVGADAMLAAYNQAREAVRRQRGERKRKAALQVRVCVCVRLGGGRAGGEAWWERRAERRGGLPVSCTSARPCAAHATHG